MYLLDEKIGRRRFVQGAAAVGAATGAGIGLARTGAPVQGQSIPVNPSGAEAWGREAGEWIPSCCNMCGGQCGIMVHVVNGGVEKIDPNHWNPNNYSNLSSDFFDGYTSEFGCKEGGALCPKGNAGIMQLYDPDRLKTPLKRMNPDKSLGADPQWQEIGWEQALDEIAAKLQALRDGGEAHKLLWISEDHSFVNVQQDFSKLYGTPNYSNHSNLCDVSRKASFRTVIGDERPLADFMQTKYIMLWGWNPTSAIKWVHLPRIITRAVEKGARLVVIDPYLSDTAVKGHEWVSLRPGTDGALALAMGHVIVRDEALRSRVRARLDDRVRRVRRVRAGQDAGVGRGDHHGAGRHDRALGARIGNDQPRHRRCLERPRSPLQWRAGRPRDRGAGRADRWL